MEIKIRPLTNRDFFTVADMLSKISGEAGRGFQPTYEELKRSWSALIENGSNSFQPTYEELKRH